MNKIKSSANIPVEEKLRNLYELQRIDSQIDEIRRMKGELPMEVADLEDEIAGLDTRIDKLKAEIADIENKISKFTAQRKEAEILIGKYERQQENVKNNREFEALSKEIELQHLDIQLADKRINDARRQISAKEQTLEAALKRKEGKVKELDQKGDELKKIIVKTEKDEQALQKKAEKARKKIEDRLLVAYDRIRTAYKNGLGVVGVERGACGGCYNQIPPQTQLEIRQRKKLIVCEHCGRVLVDNDILNPVVKKSNEGMNAAEMFDQLGDVDDENISSGTTYRDDDYFDEEF
jgi:predicted  nucleic acid-binding Zn-ribbon protein